MLTEKFYDVIKNEGVVTIVSWNSSEPHIANTWNSYLRITEDEKILIPAAGMRRTQKNTEENNKLLISLGSKEVMGYKYPGTGFVIEGSSNFLEEGKEFDAMKEAFPFLSRVLEVTITSIKQGI